MKDNKQNADISFVFLNKKTIFLKRNSLGIVFT